MTNTAKFLDKADVSIVYVCFVLSGFAALLYQVVWIREFAVIFGTSHLAVSIVLAAYMAGLASGAALVERLADGIKRPVRLYSILEIIVAAYALAFPFLAQLAGRLLPILAGISPDAPPEVTPPQQLYYLIASILILGPPTIVMGMTLPILARFVVRSVEQIGLRVANLYAANTIGAAMGTLVGGFVLLPQLGMIRTMLCGAVANLAAASIAWLLSRSERMWQHETRTSDSQANAGSLGILVPGVMLISGAISFHYEVLWTRLLTHILGGSTYAYSTMLAAFLAGIAIGGAIGGRYARTREQAINSLIIVQIGIGLASAATYHWVQIHEFEVVGLAENALLAFSVIFPGAALIGATYPIAVRCIASAVDEITEASARVYAWNTAGAIVGSVGAGFLLIPALGFDGSIKLAVVLNLLLALTLAAGKYRLSWPAGLVAAVSLLVFAGFQPERPLSLTHAASIIDDQPGREAYFGVGKSATVLVKQVNGEFFFRVDGRPEATVAPLGAPPARFNQFWLGALPAAARPDARSALLVGYGAGVAIGGLPESIDSIDVIEIEREIVSANRAISAERHRDPLDDPRLRIIVNDARAALRLTARQYDLIISQPSHPWTAGASHLYTAEFVALVRQHLASNGVFLQWINAEFVSEELLRAVAATLGAEFPYVRLYQVEPMVLMFMASLTPVEPEHGVLQLLSNPTVATRLQRIGISTREHIVATWVLHERDLESFAGGARPISDDHNRLAFGSSAGASGLDRQTLGEMLSAFDPLLDELQRNDAASDSQALVFVTQQLAAMGYLDRALRLQSETVDPHLRAMMLAVIRQSRGERPEREFAAAVEARPADQQANYGLIRNFLGELALGSDVPQSIADAAARLDGTAAAVRDGWSLGAAGDFAKLSKLDELLERARPVDLWFLEAVRLRCDWRLGLFRSSGDAVLLEQIIAITDSVLAANASTDLRARRAVSQFMLGDMRGYLETVDSVIDIIERRASSGRGSLVTRRMATDTRLLEGMLEQLPANVDGPLYTRAEELRARAARLIRQAPGQT